MRPVETIGSAKGLDAIRRLTPLRWKKLVAGALCSDTIGSVLRKAYSDRIPHRGHRIRTGSPLVSSATVAQIYFGIYERAEVDLVARFLPREYDVVEFGASLGVNSCNIASHLASGRRAVCVEADPVLASLAAETIALNGYKDRVTIVNAAVDYSGARYVTLHRGEDTLSATVFGSDIECNDSIHVETLTLGALLEQHNIGEYTIVSDVEGAEIAILLNETEVLKRCRALIIELESCTYRGEHYSLGRIRDIISGLGFVGAYGYGPCAAFLRER